ncbi:MAG: T9SS type A sorting domain-containing protein [Bacteroidetes bacterium]|nr:T9SS type A sorting domain-containing protein [Bacteroidota bacterium]
MKNAFYIHIFLLFISSTVEAQKVKWVNIIANGHLVGSITSMDKDDEGNLYFSFNYTIDHGYLQGYSSHSKIFKINTDGETDWEIGGDSTFTPSIQDIVYIQNRLFAIGTYFTKITGEGKIVFEEKGYGMPKPTIAANKRFLVYPDWYLKENENLLEVKLVKSGFNKNIEWAADLPEVIADEKVAISNDAIYFAYKKISGGQRFLRKYDFEGKLQWEINTGIFHFDLKTDEYGNAYLAGHFIGSGGVMKIKPTGEVAWVLSYPGYSFHSCLIEKNVVHLGGYEWTANYESTAYAAVNANNGELISIKNLEMFPEGRNQANHLVKHGNTIYLGGSANVNGNQTYPRAFLAKLEVEDIVIPNPTNIKEHKKEEGRIKVYPNPSYNSQFSIEYINPVATGLLIISISNSLGLNVFSKEIPSFSGNHKEEVVLQNAAPGVYIVLLKMGEAVEQKKIVLR